MRNFPPFTILYQPVYFKHKTVAIIPEVYRRWEARWDILLLFFLFAYAVGIQLTFGCKPLKNCCNCSVVPGAEKNMFVVVFAPEHNCVAIGVADGVAPVFGVLLAVAVGVPARDEDGVH
jgi:hypothetical protein